MRVLVTGASGFVGGVTCRELLARGHDVLALVRRPGSEPPGTIPLAGDLSDAGALAAAVAQAAPEGVVHLAAEIASQRDAERVREVNVEGTRRLLDACRAAGAPRFLFASTVVTGEAGGTLLTEERPLPVQTPYGESKQEGERLLAESGLPGIVIRPGHVYGPGGWYASELIPLLRRPGRFAVIGRGANWWDVVHVDDVARAIADALERAPAGALYHVADDEPIRFYDFMALTASELGRRPPRRIPVAVARIAAGRHAVTAVVRSARTSNARIRRELGWRPQYPSARHGVPAAIAALRDREGKGDAPPPGPGKPSAAVVDEGAHREDGGADAGGEVAPRFSQHPQRDAVAEREEDVGDRLRPRA
jgi:nucleoside-diphosphate-sugar epimerase